VTDVSAPRAIADGVAEPSASKRYRHPSDVARFVFSLLLLGVLLLLDLIAPNGLRVLSAELLLLVDGLPDAIADGLVGLVQLIATLLPFVLAGFMLWRREFLELLILAGAAGLAALVMSLLSNVVEDSVPIDELPFDGVNSWFIGSQYPSATYLAALTAVHVAASPWLSRSWRVTGWVFIVAVLFARALTATEVPLRGFMVVAIGVASGSFALVLIGAPRRRVNTEAVVETLAGVGVHLEGVAPLREDEGDPLYTARGADGRPFAVKVLGRDQRDADLLLSGWRAISVKGLGDSGAIRSPLRAVQREALALGLFETAGARTPTPVAVVTTPDEAAVLAMADVHGTLLAELDADGVGDGALRDVWKQVAALQDRRLAHRSLNANNLLVDGDTITLLNLRRADLQATDEILGADVAELLVATALVVGPDRALAVAADVLDADTLARGVPLVQAAVFTRPTRSRLDELDDDGKELLQQLRDGASDRAGIEKVELAEVQRITIGGIVSLVGAAVLVYYVLSLASDWDEIWDAFSRADLIYVIPILMMATATYLTGALSMLGAVPIDLRFGRTTAVMFGQSYLNRFTPANAGGMAMRIRYLQLEGLDGAVAATSIGLTSAASGIAQGLMILIFFLWGGASDRFSDFEFPDIGTIVLIILIVGFIASGVLLSTWGRKTLRPWLRRIYGKVREMLAEIAKNPRKMSQLFGGAILGKLANITAFYLSTQAFGVDISYAKAGALYMVATTIGSAVPTPGGVGGVDAALTAALLGFGIDNATAAAVVLLFRILTFWLPTLPGYFFLQYCQRHKIV
jgi:undecaprenyl-diphosphatase